MNYLGFINHWLVLLALYSGISDGRHDVFFCLVPKLLGALNVLSELNISFLKWSVAGFLLLFVSFVIRTLKSIWVSLTDANAG